MRMITALLILITFQYTATAQKRSIMHPDYVMNDVEKSIYHSVKAYNCQVATLDLAHHKRLIRFIGSPTYWLNEVNHYMEQIGYLVEPYRDPKTKELVMRYIYRMPPGYDRPYVDLIPVTSNDKIVSVKITGNYSAGIINFFIWYWELSDIKPGDIKKGVAAQQQFADDQINFKWDGTYPVITITKRTGFDSGCFND